MKLFLSLIYREFRLFSKNGVAVLIFVAAPVLYALLLGFVYQDAKVSDLSVAVVDLDNTPLSSKLIDALDDSQYLKVERVGEYSSLDLKNMFFRENINAVITIPERFEADINQKRHPEVDFDIDASNMLIANYISTGMMQVLGTMNAGIEIESLNKKGVPKSVAVQQYEAFKISMNRHYNPSSNYLVFLFPGMMGTVMQQVFMLVLALSFAKEFETNTFSELLKSSKSATYLFLVKSIPYWIIGLLLWLPLFRISSEIFHTPLAEHKIPYLLVTFLFIISVTSVGIAVSIALKTQLKATEVLMVIATPSFILSGQTWPLSQMPKAIQHISNSIPLTHYAVAVRKLLMYNVDTMDIMPQIEALFIITLVSVAFGLIVLKLKINKVTANK